MSQLEWSVSESNLGKALILCGGWEGHNPTAFTEFAQRELLSDFDVEVSTELSALTLENLARFDVLLPIWTFGEIDGAQERALLSSVEDGLGIVAWHGATSAFLRSRPHKHLLGGQFVAHPGGDSTEFKVRFLHNDPLVMGLDHVTVTSEQYYMLVDPGVKVLATTTMLSEDEMVWLRDVEVPVAWLRRWGDGRVFYCSLGHTVKDLDSDTMKTLLRRALQWARRGAEAPSLAAVTQLV